MELLGITMRITRLNSSYRELSFKYVPNMPSQSGFSIAWQLVMLQHELPGNAKTTDQGFGKLSMEWVNPGGA